MEMWMSTSAATMMNMLLLWSSFLSIILVNGQVQMQQGHMTQQGYATNQAYGQPAMGQPQHGSMGGGHQHAAGGHQANIIDKAHVQDREHIKEHLEGVINQPDISKMSEEELQFHYFKLHDSDNNNKLDGCELIKSVLHWHVEENKQLGPNASPQGTTKIFTDNELSMMVDPILDMDDRNKDGFIDYPEFINAQKTRGF